MISISFNKELTLNKSGPPDDLIRTITFDRDLPRALHHWEGEFECERTRYVRAIHSVSNKNADMRKIRQGIDARLFSAPSVTLNRS